LVSTLSGLFSTNRIRLAHDLPNLEVLRRECQAFLRNWTGSGRATFSASGSNHDDTISALSLACWWASMKIRQLGRDGAAEISIKAGSKG